MKENQMKIIKSRITNVKDFFSVKIAATEVARFVFKAVFELLIYAVLIVMSLGSSIGLMLLLTFIFLNVRKDVKMAFADPEDFEYERKTDGELYGFVLHSCVTAVMFAVISFQIFIYLSLLFWFYFIIFTLMFSKVWKFHGKKRFHLFSIIISTVVISFAAAPYIRDTIHMFLNFLGIY